MFNDNEKTESEIAGELVNADPNSSYIIVNPPCDRFAEKNLIASLLSLEFIYLLIDLVCGPRRECWCRVKAPSNVP